MITKMKAVGPRHPGWNMWLMIDSMSLWVIPAGQRRILKGLLSFSWPCNSVCWTLRFIKSRCLSLNRDQPLTTQDWLQIWHYCVLLQWSVWIATTECVQSEWVQQGECFYSCEKSTVLSTSLAAAWHWLSSLFNRLSLIHNSFSLCGGCNQQAIRRELQSRSRTW